MSTTNALHTSTFAGGDDRFLKSSRMPCESSIALFTRPHIPFKLTKRRIKVNKQKHNVHTAWHESPRCVNVIPVHINNQMIL